MTNPKTYYCAWHPEIREHDHILATEAFRMCNKKQQLFDHWQKLKDETTIQTACRAIYMLV